MCTIPKFNYTGLHAAGIAARAETIWGGHFFITTKLRNRRRFVCSRVRKRCRHVQNNSIEGDSGLVAFQEGRSSYRLCDRSHIERSELCTRSNVNLVIAFK